MLWKIEEMDLKIDSIIPKVRRSKYMSHDIERIETKSEEWNLEKLCTEMHRQLDSRWIKDEKDGNWKRKYRERARSYVHNLPEDGLVHFDIDETDLTGRVKEEFYNLDDGAIDHVVTEVIGRIFDSIDKTYLNVRVRDFVSWHIRESEDNAYGN